MQVQKTKLGYKLVKSLFGKYEEIPEEWSFERIVDNSTLKGRIGWQGLTTAEYRQQGEFYLVTGTDFKDGRIDWKNCVYVDEERYSQDTNIQLKKGDVLVTKDGTIGKIAYIDTLPLPATLNSGVFVIRPVNNEYLTLFLFYILNSNYFVIFLNRLTAGSTINHLYQKDFVNFHFPIPLYTEQQKITSILSNVDNLISSYNSLIESTKKLKKGLMQKLLTKGIGHTKFKKIKWLFGKEIEIPEEWEISSLEKCVKEVITYGIVQAGPNAENGVPYVRTGDMSGNKLTSKGMLRTSPNIASKYKRSTIRTGELVFAIRATVGKVLEVSEELDGANLTQGTARISPKDDFSNHFVMYSLRSENTRKQITSMIKGTTFMEITLQNLRRIKILVPPYKEQQKIASILTTFDKLTDELEHNKSNLENLKKGLMQKLLTGQIRVKVGLSN